LKFYYEIFQDYSQDLSASNVQFYGILLICLDMARTTIQSLKK